LVLDGSMVASMANRPPQAVRGKSLTPTQPTLNLPPPEGNEVLDSKPRVPHCSIVDLNEFSKKHRLRQKEPEQFILVRFFAVWAHGDSWYELLTREEPATAVGKAAKKLFYQEVASSRPRNNGPDAVGFACCPGTYSPEDKTL